MAKFVLLAVTIMVRWVGEPEVRQKRNDVRLVVSATHPPPHVLSSPLTLLHFPLSPLPPRSPSAPSPLETPRPLGPFNPSTPLSPSPSPPYVLDITAFPVLPGICATAATQEPVVVSFPREARTNREFYR